MKIKIFKQGNLLKEYELSKGLFVLGRSEDCDICLLDDVISRKHVEFRFIDDKNVAFAKKSKFGELIKDGSPVEEGRLVLGESLDIGDIKLVFGGDEVVSKEEVKEEQAAPEAHKVEETKDPKKAKSDFELFTMSIDSDSLPELREQLSADIKKDSKKSAQEASKVEDIIEDLKQNEEDKSTEKVSSTTNISPPLPTVGSFGDETMVGPARLLYQLVTISGPYKDKLFPLEKDSVILGRSNKAGIVLVDDLVSREHARIYRQGVDSLVVDLGSANGIKVNGKKVTDPVSLNSGDIIEVGSSAFRFMAINPQVQSVKGVSETSSSSSRGRPPVIEKISDLSDAQVKKIEKSYGAGEGGPERSKRPILIVAALVVIGAVLFFAFSGPSKEELEKARLEAERKAKEAEAAAAVEEVPEVKCLEEGLCHLPLAVQKQLQGEYDVGIRLFKNYQYEIAEDRARQILEKAPDWGKAQELLRVASEAKEQLLAQKQQEEESTIRKMLEEKIAKLLIKAREQYRQGKYDELRETISGVFEVDPNNKEAKDLADKLDQMAEDIKKAQEKRAQFLAAVQGYKKIFSEGKRFFDRKEYLKAIETFQRCVGMSQVNSDDVREMRSESKRLISESTRLLKEAVAPELSVAEQALMSSQYREAIASYQRVLRMDYKNKTAKVGLEKAKSALSETAKDYFSRALIAESVSDFKTACRDYNAVVEMAIPGTKYYNLAIEKVRKRCTSR